MSRYGYLICESSRQMICLGKGVFDESGNPDTFDLFASSSLEARSTMHRAIVTFLARNAGRAMHVAFDYEIANRLDSDPLVEIGGDAEGDISFLSYLEGVWDPDA